MKKIILFISIIIVLTGCGNLMNTPTKQVEELFSKYQSYDNDIENELDTLLDKETLTDSQKKKFTSKDAFINKLNQYLNYMSFDTDRRIKYGTTNLFNIYNQLNIDYDVFSEDFIRLLDGVMTEKKLDEKYIVKNGDVLISWSGSLGVYEWNGDIAYLNQHIF